MPHFSKTTKMKCLSWGIPSKYCDTGGKLRKAGQEKNKMTSCRFCYTFSGPISWTNSQSKLEENYLEWKKDRGRWVRLITALIEIESCKFFRWFHSGDLQGMEMFLDICEIAKNCEDVFFWLPTQERKIIKNFLEEGKKIPENLTVRISSPLFDIPIKSLPQTTTSMVGLKDSEGFLCPAKDNEGNCGSCRECWKKTETITYPLKIGGNYRPKKYLKD